MQTEKDICADRHAGRKTDMQAGRQTETVIPVYNANHDLHWSVVVVFWVGQVARPSHPEDSLFSPSTFKSRSYHYGSKSRSCHYARINLLCIHPQFKGSTGVHADGGKCCGEQRRFLHCTE